MYKLLKSIYYLIPGKRIIFILIRNLYVPTKRIAGYLKFKGIFRLAIDKNISVLIYNDNSTIPTLLFWHGFKGHEYMSLSIWAILSKKSSSILDLGANFGLFGLISKRINPNANLIFFEPLTRNNERIRRNLTINNMNAHVEEIAVSNFNGTETFYDMDSDENTIASFKKEFVEMHKHHKKLIPIEVSVKKLDTYIIEEKIDVVDLVKIDVEGSDYEVLQGFTETMEKFKPKILIEITDRVSANKISKLLDRLSFRYIIYEIDETSGLIQRKSLERSTNRNFLLSYSEVNFSL